MSTRARKLLLAVLLVPLILCSDVSAQDADLLEQWARFGRTDGARRMLSWLRCRMREEVTGVQCNAEPNFSAPPFYGKLGLFVTIVRGRTVRGCYGAFHHSTDSLETALAGYVRGAVRRDDRNRPLDVAEMWDARIIVTIAGAEMPVGDINSIDISRHGFIITYVDERRAVFVPSEITDISTLKRLASGKYVAQVSCFRAVTIDERLTKPPQ
jgi:AMMECR1 domain-containing protein